MIDYFLALDRLNQALEEGNEWLPPEILETFQDYVAHNELELAIEILVDQLYEIEFPITEAFRELVDQAATELSCCSKRLTYLRELPLRS